MKSRAKKSRPKDGPVIRHAGGTVLVFHVLDMPSRFGESADGQIPFTTDSFTEPFEPVSPHNQTEFMRTAVRTSVFRHDST